MGLFDFIKSKTKKQTSASQLPFAGNINLISAPPPSNNKTYRKIRKNPTVALGRAIRTAPILSSNWSYEAKEAADDELVEEVRTFSERLRMWFLRHACFSMDYGYKPFEVVWEYDNGKYVPAYLKPLNVDKTEPKLDDSGRLIGLKNYDVELTEQYIMWISHEAEDDDPKGTSMYEAIRETSYAGWEEIYKKLMLYITKVAGVIPMIEYPPGEDEDQSGATRPTFEIAMNILNKLGGGQGVIMPNALAVAAQDLLERGASVEDLRAWSIKFIESSGQHGGDLTEMMRHMETCMLRGLLIPERAATEGQYGTKAEAEVHTNLMLGISQLWCESLVTQFNEQLVDKYLELNYGKEFKGQVYVVASPLMDEISYMIREIMQSTLQGNAELIEQWLDVDAMLDSIGLPKIKGIVNAEEESDMEESSMEEGGDGEGGGPSDQEGGDNGEADGMGITEGQDEI